MLPSPIIEDVAGKPVRSINLSALATLRSDAKWWQYEALVTVDFESEAGDDSAKIASVCGKCGQCCKDIPSHQIGIYMSPKERAIAELAGHVVKSQGKVTVDDVEFDILDVEGNGDCSMLTDTGCSLGDLKPLWCKVYHCERFVGSMPPWMTPDSLTINKQTS